MTLEVRYCLNEECGKLLVQRETEQLRSFKRRRTCGPHCGAKAGQQMMRANGVVRQPYVSREREIYHWARPTGELTADFRGTEVKPGAADGILIKLVRPDVQSYAGCAAARCAE